MCGLYGYSFYGEQSKVHKGLPEFIKKLGKAAAIRGTDATGIAYNMDDKLHIEKDGCDAYKFKFPMPEEVLACMGHVRRTTQGTEKKNFNNHPFRGKASNCQFALAHNGVITNEFRLRSWFKLPWSKIETDSYIVVQLLEHFGELNMENVIKMAEEVEGMFTFTILDEYNRIWIVKNDSPLSIAHFPNLNLYAYASTSEILMDACLGWGKTEGEIMDTFREQQVFMELYEPQAGAILVLNPDGSVETGVFHPRKRSYYGGGKSYKYWDYDSGWPMGTGTVADYPAASYTKYNEQGLATGSALDEEDDIDDLKTDLEKKANDDEKLYYKLLVDECEHAGVPEDVVDRLIEYGWDLYDIEEALNNGTITEAVTEMEEYEDFFEKKYEKTAAEVKKEQALLCSQNSTTTTAAAATTEGASVVITK